MRKFLLYSLVFMYVVALLFMLTSCGGIPNVYPPKVQHQVNDIHPQISDIYQTSDGDCWLLAAIGAAVWTDPNNINNMFTQTPDPNVFVVSVWDTSNPYDPYKRINFEVDSNDFINDWFIFQPAYYSDGTLITWPNYILSAVIKLNDLTHFNNESDGDLGINIGHSNVGLETILGYQFITQDLDPDPNAMLGMLEQAHTTPMTISTVQYPLDPNRFVANHSYTVLGVDNGEAIIRNPWGSSYKSKNGIERVNVDQLYTNFYQVSVPALMVTYSLHND